MADIKRHFNKESGKYTCNYCGHDLAATTSTTRLRAHLVGVLNSGTKSCPNVPDDVRKTLSLCEVNQRQKTATTYIPSPSNITTSVLPGANNYLENQDLRNFSLMDQADQHEVRDQESAQRTQREGILQSSNKRQRSTPDALPIITALEVPTVKGVQDSPPTKRLVGDGFKRNGEKIWSWLMDDQVLRVGIYGMGGVGKTAIMRHIQTRLKGESSFEVYWIPVSQDFSICKLQNIIAKKIGLSFSDEEDEEDRAVKLTQSLKAKGKCVLILDDLWNEFDVDEVGIPLGVNLCRLALTTRLVEVCRQMDCTDGNTIKVQALWEEEAWVLFTQELGNYRTEGEELAKAVCRKCDGLPLGIRVMAKYMKKNCNLHTWRNTLEELKELKLSRGHEMLQVFSVLQFSYLHLYDPALRECLSYCALFPKDYKFDRDELIEYMIVEGIIDERSSRKAEYDKGHTMLDTLENACLLEGDNLKVWMHDLIRDMVILELKVGSKTLVEAGAQLKELPDVEKWTENLVKVSLVRNDIEVIPPSHRPRCPNLSTLLLCDNRRLKMIADSFFEQFQSLNILDLSWCSEIEELPRSISDLVNLTGLSLRGCCRLIHVPSLAKLEKLKRLDLSFCVNVEEMPEGVRFLFKLKYLDLSWTAIEGIGSGIIPMLSRLQVLLVCEHIKFSIRGSEVGELRMLETLHCRFNDVGEFGEYMKSLKKLKQPPTDLSIFTQLGNSYMEYSRKLGSRKKMKISGYSFIDLLALPTDIEKLKIVDCYSTLYKSLFSPSLLPSFSNLQEIHVSCMDNIEEIFATIKGENGEGRGFPFSKYSTHSLLYHSLLNLKRIEIWACHKVKKLFPPSLLLNLHNLYTISVQLCNEMEEIFSTDQEELARQELLCDRPNLSALHLPKLSRFELRYLPNLRSIYKGAIICHSLHKILLVECPKLKRIPISLPQPSLQRIQVYPEEWWDSVQWGSADDKEHLNSLIVFDKSWEPDSDGSP